MSNKTKSKKKSECIIRKENPEIITKKQEVMADREENNM